MEGRARLRQAPAGQCRGQAVWRCFLTDTVFFQKSARMFVGDLGAPRIRDIAREIGSADGAVVGHRAAHLHSRPVRDGELCADAGFFRATAFDFWGVVLCVAMMSISGLFYIIGGQYLISKVWRLVPISDLAPGWRRGAS